MDLHEFNERFPGLEEKLGKHLPDIALVTHDVLIKNREILINRAPFVSFAEFANSDWGLIEMDSQQSEDDQTTILFSMDMLGSNKSIVPEHGVRIKVEESTVKGIEGGQDYVLHGASIGKFMTKKGEFKRDCNLILTPVRYIDDWGNISRLTDEDIEKFTNAGVIEVRNGQMMAVDTSSESVVTPQVTSVCRIDVDDEIMHTLPWRSPSSLESES